MLLERLLDDPALNAFATTVNEADFAQTGLVRRVDIGFNDRFDVAGREGVEIERVFNRDAMSHSNPKIQIPNPNGPWFSLGFGIWGLGFGICHPASKEAVTTVFMPPRTEKSPTTVMRRG